MRDVIYAHPEYRKLSDAYAEHDRERERRHELMTKAIARFEKARAEHQAAVAAAVEAGEVAPSPPVWTSPCNTAELFAMRDDIDRLASRWIAEHRTELLEALATEEAAWSEKVARALDTLDALARDGVELRAQAERVHQAPPRAWEGWTECIDAGALCVMRATNSTPLRATARSSAGLDVRSG